MDRQLKSLIQALEEFRGRPLQPTPNWIGRHVSPADAYRAGFEDAKRQMGEIVEFEIGHQPKD